MTNRKAELEVSEAEMMLRQRHWICVREWADSRANDFVKGETVPTERTMLAMSRMEEELTALLRAVAASGSPPSPTPLNAKDKQDAERWRMFISKAHAGVTEDGDIWCGFSGGEPDDYTDVLTLKQVETLNNDDPSPRMAKDIVRRLIDDLVGARASSGSTGAPNDQPTPTDPATAEPPSYASTIEACAQVADSVAANYPHDMAAAVKTRSNAGAGDAIGASRAAREIARQIRAMYVHPVRSGSAPE